MVEVSVEYLGDLRTRATHGPSGGTLITDAPVDNCGQGRDFSPTDLVGTAMGTCMLTILGIFAQRHSLQVAGARARVTKEMAAAPLRRISRLATEIHIPLPPDHPHRAAIERAILTCPVHASLHAEMEKPVQFHWVA